MKKLKTSTRNYKLYEGSRRNEIRKFLTSLQAISEDSKSFEEWEKNFIGNVIRKKFRTYHAVWYAIRIVYRTALHASWQAVQDGRVTAEERSKDLKKYERLVKQGLLSTKDVGNDYLMLTGKISPGGADGEHGQLEAMLEGIWSVIDENPTGIGPYYLREWNALPWDRGFRGLKDLSMHEMYGEINSLRSRVGVDKPRQVAELAQGKDILTLKEGTWVRLAVSHCPNEGALAMHCGNASGGDGYIISFRVDAPQYKSFPQVVDAGVIPRIPRLTFLVKKGYLTEMKHIQNTKPPKQYHEAIVRLLSLPESVTGIKGLKGGGYLSENNFSLNDLTDEDIVRVFTARPDLSLKDNEATASMQRVKQVLEDNGMIKGYAIMRSAGKRSRDDDTNDFDEDM